MMTMEIKLVSSSRFIYFDGLLYLYSSKYRYMTTTENQKQIISHLYAGLGTERRPL